MPLTGKDVWDAIVRLGLMTGPYDPRTNRSCANAENIARLLNEALTKSQTWLPNPIKRWGVGSQYSSRIRHAALQVPQYDGLHGGRDRRCD